MQIFHKAYPSSLSMQMWLCQSCTTILLDPLVISVLKQLTEFKMCFRRHLFSLREHPVFWLKFLVSPAERFFLRIKQGEKRKRCYPKSDFQLWQATHFSTKNTINKPAMNNRRLLIAAVFHFVYPVGETRNLTRKKRILSQANIYCAY